MAALIYKFKYIAGFIVILFLTLSWPQASLGARGTVILGSDTKIVEGRNQREACPRAYEAACESAQAIAKTKNAEDECRSFCATQCGDRGCSDSEAAGRSGEKRKNCRPTQDTPPNYQATCNIEVVCSYTCSPRGGQLPQPTLLQRLFGIGEPNVVDVTPQQVAQKTALVQSVTLTAAKAAKNPSIARNDSDQPRSVIVTATNLQTGEQYAGEAILPPNSKKEVRVKNVPKNGVVTYTVEGGDGRAGFVVVDSATERHRKLLKELFGNNDSAAIEIRAHKDGVRLSYSVTSQNPDEPLEVIFKGQAVKVREIRETVNVSESNNNYNLTFDGLSVLRGEGEDEWAKVLAMLLSGGGSLLVQWIPVPEKPQEPPTGGTSGGEPGGGGAGGGEPPTGGVPPRGQCRPSTLSGSDLERTWRERGHDLISSCSWVNTGHALETSFNASGWGPGHNFGRSNLDAPLSQ